MKTRNYLLLACALLIGGVGLARAEGGLELSVFGIPSLDNLAASAIASGDTIPVYDSSTDKVKEVPAENFGVGLASGEVVITTNVITTDECGKTFYLSLAGGFTSTLPAPTLGCKMNFVVKTAPTTAYVIVSTSGANIIAVSVNELETDTGDDGPYDDNADTVNFVANVAAIGDFLECSSDGTLWYCKGQTNLDGAVTSSTT